MREIADRLRALGWTATDGARSAECSVGHFTRCLKGERELAEDMRARLLEALDRAERDAALERAERVVGRFAIETARDLLRGTAAESGSSR